MFSNSWKDYALTIVVSVLLALMVRTFVITAYRVPTGSMQPTLKAGDFIFSYRLAYGFHSPFGGDVSEAKAPERGDVVVFSYPNQPHVSYVKRVIAIPGDHVQIVSGKLVINEIPLEYELQSEVAPGDNPNPESFDVFIEKQDGQKRQVIFQKNNTSQNFGPLVVPPGELFLLGDNRDASDDSRYWGTVPTGQIFGKVLFIWLSLDWQNRWGADRYPSLRWKRIFTEVH